MTFAFFAPFIGFLRKVPGEVWIALIAIAAILYYGHVRYNDGREDEAARRDKIVAAAVLKAIEAEREAAAKHDKREAERQATTNELREAVNAAPVGEKTKAVLKTLRQQAGEAAR